MQAVFLVTVGNVVRWGRVYGLEDAASTPRARMEIQIGTISLTRAPRRSVRNAGSPDPVS